MHIHHSMLHIYIDTVYMWILWFLKRGANGRFQLPCASLEVPGSTGSMMNPMGLCGLFKDA